MTMSYEEKDDSVLANINTRPKPGRQQTNQVQSPILGTNRMKSNLSSNHQLNAAKKNQMPSSESNAISSGPGPSSNRMNMIHNKLNSREDINKTNSKSNKEIALDSPEEFPTIRRMNSIQSPNSKSIQKIKNDDIEMDTVDDDDDDEEVEEREEEEEEEEEEEDDDENDADNDVDDDDYGEEDEEEKDKRNNKDKSVDKNKIVEVDDGVFKLAGFVDDDADDLEVDDDVLRKIYNMNGLLRPFVDLYTTPKAYHNRKEAPRFMLEIYNAWLKNYSARNPPVEPQPGSEDSPSPAKQTFADKMKSSNSTIGKNKQERLVNLVDIECYGQNKIDDKVNNRTGDIPSPLRDKEYMFKEVTISRKPLDVSDVESRNKSQTTVKELRSPQSSGTNSFSGRSKTSPKEFRSNNSAAASSSNIVELTSDEKWNPQTGSWTSSNRKPRNKPQLYSSPDTKRVNDLQKSEEKVQCPICQLNYPKSKVEGHAAICDQFPVETRSNNQESIMNNLGSSKNASAAMNNSVDLTDTNSDEEWETQGRIKNKRKGCRDEDDDSLLEDLKGTHIIPVKRK